uniref:Uncharacterized protein n=1 Tax=Ditylenchus dipsaci TaxID=166011 RepID=A0A915EJV8_9BILA
MRYPILSPHAVLILRLSWCIHHLLADNYYVSGTTKNGEASSANNAGKEVRLEIAAPPGSNSQHGSLRTPELCIIICLFCRSESRKRLQAFLRDLRKISVSQKRPLLIRLLMESKPPRRNAYAKGALVIAIYVSFIYFLLQVAKSYAMLEKYDRYSSPKK